MIGKTLSHYKILEKLGEGGMGVVYKAQDTKLDRIVALKFLPQHSFADEDTKARFVQEAKAASAIDHPNISTVHDIDEVDGQTFISMAYVDGRSLKEMAKAGDVPIQEIIKIAVQAAEGLGAAHKKGIVHRDVKSDNLMMTSDGHVKVMDFGLAKLKGSSGLTKAGQTVGTAYYMSPEQTKGEDVDQRSDIFSFGVVLYELITGQLPFTGDYDPAIAYAIINEPFKPVSELRPDVPPELESIVAKALEKDTAKRYQSMEEVVSDIRNLWEGRTSEIRPIVSSSPSKLRLIVPAAAIVILAAIFALKFVPGRGAPTAPLENTLAVMYFDNMVDAGDTGRLGEIVANLLITDLSDSRFVKVVSSQRLYDILKLLGREGTKTIDRDVATQIAEKARAKWMLLGSIIQTEPYLVVTSQLVEVQDGHIVESQRITGTKDEEVFDIVDRLTVEVKKDLELPDEALEEPDAPVADVTTASPEAYKHYLEGMDYFNKAYLPEASASFLKAVELDTTFAMAYFRLAIAQIGSAHAEGFRTIEKAVELSDRVTNREQYFIRGFKAFSVSDTEEGLRNLQQLVDQYPDEKEGFFWLGAVHYQTGDYENAVPMLNRAVELDPTYQSPLNMLAYAYNAMGDFEKSIWAINKYISLAPEDANPYDTRGELYAQNGELDLAIESYEMAVEKKPDFGPSLEALGLLWLQKRDYEKARFYFTELARNSNQGLRGRGRNCLALIPLYRGQYVQGLESLENTKAASIVEGAGDLYMATLYGIRAGVYEETGDLDSALKDVEAVVEIVNRVMPGQPVQFMDYHGFILALRGDTGKADKVAELMRERIEVTEPSRMFDYWQLKGEIERAKGNLDKAVEHMEQSNEIAHGLNFGTRFALARVYLEAGRMGDAVPILEYAINRYDSGRLASPIQSVKLHYMLGKAYEGSGWTEKAMAQYEEFVGILSDADPGNSDLMDAVERLARLKSGT
jgi:tetratricopeptide (TPR) repeat protein/predicted Ser/Thr protein kinase